MKKLSDEKLRERREARVKKALESIPLLPCPFCGREAEGEWFYGGGPSSTMIHCSNADCHAQPNVTGPKPQWTANRWNLRA